MSLLDFLRKTNARGEIVDWLKTSHAAAADGGSLQDYAAAYVVKGEKFVAADTLSRMNDRFPLQVGWTKTLGLKGF